MDWITCVVAPRRYREEFPQRHARRERDYVRARDHDLARPPLLQLEDRLEHVLLAGVQNAPASGLLDDDPQLLLGVGLLGLGGGRHAEEPDHGVGRSVENVDARQKEVVEELHEGGDEQRGSLGPGDSYALGCKLSEDHVQEGYRPEGCGEGYDVGAALRYAQRLQERLEDMGEGGFSYPPEPQRGDRDAKLAHREVGVQPPGGVLYQTRRRPPFLDKAVHLGGPDLHEPEFGGDE
jgi:hypothetical protein